MVLFLVSFLFLFALRFYFQFWVFLYNVTPHTLLHIIFCLHFFFGVNSKIPSFHTHTPTHTPPHTCQNTLNNEGYYNHQSLHNLKINGLNFRNITSSQLSATSCTADCDNYKCPTFTIFNFSCNMCIWLQHVRLLLVIPCYGITHVLFCRL